MRDGDLGDDLRCLVVGAGDAMSKIENHYNGVERLDSVEIAFNILVAIGGAIVLSRCAVYLTRMLW